MALTVIGERAKMLLVVIERLNADGMPVSRGLLEKKVHDVRSLVFPGKPDQQWREWLYAALSVLTQSGYVVATDLGYRVTPEGQEYLVANNLGYRVTPEGQAYLREV